MDIRKTGKVVLGVSLVVTAIIMHYQQWQLRSYHTFMPLILPMCIFLISTLVFTLLLRIRIPRLFDNYNEFLGVYLLVGFLISWLPLALLISTNYYLADKAKYYVTVPVDAQGTGTSKSGESYGWVEVERNGYMKRITFSYWTTSRDRRIDKVRFCMSRGFWGYEVYDKYELLSDE